MIKSDYRMFHKLATVVFWCLTIKFQSIDLMQAQARIDWFTEIMIFVIPPNSNTNTPNSLGRTKLTNSPGKQQHELSTRL